jgi:hypothetical protein
MNIIEFSAREDYLLQIDYPKPEPISLNLPDWYKNLKYGKGNLTVKGCVPFLESLTTGYVLKLPQDFHLKFNFDTEKNGKKVKDTTIEAPNAQLRFLANINGVGLNLNHSDPETHDPFQVEGSEFNKKNLGYKIGKFLNPWVIKTPPGYACLFIPPLNNQDDRFSIISGIVDTDKFYSQVNFPFIINGDKYKTLDTILKRGTPYVQVIPFKKESWKMQIKKIEEKKSIATILNIRQLLINNYRNFFWNKITWK